MRKVLIVLPIFLSFYLKASTYRGEITPVQNKKTPSGIIEISKDSEICKIRVSSFRPGPWVVLNLKYCTTHYCVSLMDLNSSSSQQKFFRCFDDQKFENVSFKIDDIELYQTVAEFKLKKVKNEED